MITPLQFRIWKQRDSRWANQRLGTVNGTTLGQFGCLISTIAMAQGAYDPANPLTPAQVDDLFTNNNGYANGNLVVWTAIQRLLPHVAHLGADNCVYSPAPIAKLKQHLDNGGLAALQVGFNGHPEQMHWVLADGYNGDNIVKCDPWYGDETDFTSTNSAGHPRYGTGDASRDILSIHYFAQGVAPTPPPPVADPPPKPVAKLPMDNPVPVEETVPNGSDPAVPVPVTVTPEYEATYHTGAEKRTVEQDGVAVNVLTGETIEGSRPNLVAGKEVNVAGYFTYQGVHYARTVFAAANNLWNGVDVTYFDAPTGQLNGEVPVTVAETSHPDANPIVLPAEPAPELSKLTVKQLFIELIAQLVAKIIKRRKNK